MEPPSILHETGPVPRSGRSDPFALWRSMHEGFAPLYCATLVRETFAWLAPRLGPGRSVLDLGCGRGQAAEALAAAGGLAAGVDHDLPLLRDARGAHPTRVFAAARVQALPFRDASVDAVFCYSVFQYLDRGGALRELFRVLRPGGRFAVVENLRGNPVARAYRALCAMRGVETGALRHPGWSERNDYLKSFPGTRFSAHHVCSPALLFSGVLSHAPADTPDDAWTTRTLRWTERFDRFVLDRFPGAAAAAWLMLATGSKP